MNRMFVALITAASASVEEPPPPLKATGTPIEEPSERDLERRMFEGLSLDFGGNRKYKPKPSNPEAQAAAEAKRARRRERNLRNRKV